MSVSTVCAQWESLRASNARYLLRRSLVLRIMNLLTFSPSAFIASSPFSFCLSVASPSRPLTMASSNCLWNSVAVPSEPGLQKLMRAKYSTRSFCSRRHVSAGRLTPAKKRTNLDGRACEDDASLAVDLHNRLIRRVVCGRERQHRAWWQATSRKTHSGS